MTQSEGVINWLSISDVHLGNIRTPAEFILDNLERELFNGRLVGLQLFVIAGDLFDRQLEYNHPASGRILLFVDRLMQECSTHNVKLRVLEGTPSHDNKQNKIFDDVYSLGKYSCDMKYVSTLMVEYIPDWDMRILYVPDKIRTTVNEIYQDTLRIFDSLKIETVDLAIMHGAFSHQLPAMAKEVHDPISWLKLVKHWILVGHIHQHSILDRIAAQGSFDRIAQGEESAKGFLMGTLNLKGDSSKDQIYFIENKGAKKYVTINCTNLPVDKSLSKIESIVEKLPNDSYIRIRAEAGNAIFSNMNEIKKFNLSNFWSTDDQSEKEEDKATVEKEEGLELWAPIHIDENNITDLIMKRLVAKNNSGVILELAEKILNDFK